MPTLALVLNNMGTEMLRIFMAVLMLFGPAVVLICGLRMERRPVKEMNSKKGYCTKIPCTDQAQWDRLQRIAGAYYINTSLIGLAVAAVLAVVMVILPVDKAVLMLPVTIVIQFAGLLIMYALINRAARRSRKKRTLPSEQADSIEE